MTPESLFQHDLLMQDGSPTARAMCTECGRMFSTDGNFDRHRKVRRLSEHDSYCEDPSKVGLILGRHGIWHLPGPQESPFRLSA
jgi:hypothetical protein